MALTPTSTRGFVTSTNKNTPNYKNPKCMKIQVQQYDTIIQLKDEKNSIS